MIELLFSKTKDFIDPIVISNIPICDYVLGLGDNEDLDFINHDIKNLIFKKFYEEIRQIDFTIYKFLKVRFFKQDFPVIKEIKDCVYRIVGYSYGGKKYEERELLSFKFMTDAKYKIQDGIIYCDNCIHLQSNHCQKYREDIVNNKICRLCYLSINIPVERQLKLEQYMRCQYEMEE